MLKDDGDLWIIGGKNKNDLRKTKIFFITRGNSSMDQSRLGSIHDGNGTRGIR